MVNAPLGATVMVQPSEVCTTAPPFGMMIWSLSPALGSAEVSSLALSTKPIFQAPEVVVVTVPPRLSVQGRPVQSLNTGSGLMANIPSPVAGVLPPAAECVQVTVMTGLVAGTLNV